MGRGGLGQPKSNRYKAIYTIKMYCFFRPVNKNPNHAILNHVTTIQLYPNSMKQKMQLKAC